MRNIVEKFAVQGEVAEIKCFDGGLINSTFVVKTAGDSPDYILQCINHSIFKDVPLVQRNIEAVTAHIRHKLEISGESDIDRKVLTLIPLAGSARTYYYDGGKYWRMMLYIRDSVTRKDVDADSAYITGLSFGNFQYQLSDCEARIGESIPDFHNMELRISQLHEAVEADRAGRAGSEEAREITAYLRSYEKEMSKAEDLYREGLLPKRICHCDTKLSNILFDKDGAVLCVIDLDTLMPSFVFSDFGDFLRTAGSTVAEDDPAIEKVEFRMDIFRAFAKGYVESAGFLTPVEKENLPYAALRFSYMQAVRFFADYLNGDTYYRTSYPEHNLVRTRNQLALFKSQMKCLEEMKSFIASL